MTFAARQARMQRERPITDRHTLWAAWLLGAASFHHPGRLRPPLHPDTNREYYSGAAAAGSGFVNVPDLAEALELARHVQAGNTPHTFRRVQPGLPL